MDGIRFVPAVLHMVYEEGTSENASFLQEYYALMQLNDDPLGVWLKSSKIRKAAEESDPVLLTLLIELHRKIETLTHLVTSKTPLVLELKESAMLSDIAHGYLRLSEAVLTPQKGYYARIAMPTFPQRSMPLFFEAVDAFVGKIVLMHEDDEQEWSAYMTACERAMIRQMKGNGSEY